MHCPSCQSATFKKHGNTSDGRPRFRCTECRRVWVDTKLPKPARRSRRVSDEQTAQLIGLLCEGVSVRAAERLTGLGQRTILRLLVDLGAGCERLLEEKIKDVQVKDVEADELWSYIYCNNATKERKKIDNPDAGDAYCYLGIEKNTGLVLTFHLGRRNSWDAHDFIVKLSNATAGTFQLSTDGFAGYPNAVEFAFGARVNYAQVVKEFASAGGQEARRYGPPRLISQEKKLFTVSRRRIAFLPAILSGSTGPCHGLRRFVRLSNGFSRKKENMRAAIALFLVYYNFVKFHKTVRMPPAMAAGLITKPWSVLDLLREAEQRVDRTAATATTLAVAV